LVEGKGRIVLEKCCNNPLATVVITNYNRCSDLQAAIKSVKDQDYPNVEIVVVDNASNDNSRMVIMEGFPDVRLITLNENLGMYGYSVGFQHAKGEFVFQMDNDSLMPDRNVLSQVVKRFKEGPSDLGVIATRVEEYNGDVNSIDKLRSLDDRCGQVNSRGFHSGGVGFRRSLLDRVGYYNQDVFLYGSELFLQMKFLAAGLRVFYYPEILILHKSSVIARSTNGIYYELRNRYWFMRHFASRAQQRRFLPTMILHDAFYSIYRKCPVTFIRSLRDGFGRLPQSLRIPLRSRDPKFISKIDEVGFHFSLEKSKTRLVNSLKK